MKLFVVLLALLAAACTPMGNLNPSGPVRYLQPEDIARMAKQPTRIYPGDVLRIMRDAQDASLDLRNLVEDSQTQLYTVRSDGSFSYRFVGRVDAAGKTPDEVAAFITAKLEPHYRQPGVTVNIATSPSSRVVIGGAVRAPGTIDINAVASLEQGLFAVGGLMPSADPTHVALLRMDEQQRYQLYFIDMSKLLEQVPGGTTTLAFQRGDLLFVPKSVAGNAGDGVDVYINQLLPFSRSVGLGYSFTYGETRFK